MLKSEAAAYLAGVTQTEGAEASAPTNLHVITGEVGEASADGKTLVKIDGLMFSESDDQFIEVDALGGLEEGDIATIVLTGEQGHAMTPLALGSIGSVDRITVRIAAIEADYIKVEQLDAAEARIGDLEADHVSVDDLNAATARIGTLETTRATITDLEAATARIGDLEADHVSTDDLNAATARIGTLEADHVSTDDLNAAKARIGTLETNTADIGTIRANSAKVQNLTAAELEADHATVGSLSTTYATIANLNAANGRITNLESTKANISDLEADYITADEIEATYMHANMSNSDVAWIQNGTIKDGAIVSAMINDVSANKLTAGTINGSVINVTNLNADNITTGTINGQRIGEGSLSLSKLEDDVYTESEVDAKLATMQAEIDGAIETWTGTSVPTLNNSPASNWTTAAVRDTHVGDVYFVVNSQSQQNGYNYRFTKSGSTYSWQLIKDSDVTNALQRLETAEGKITTFDSDISTLKTDTGSLTTRTTNLETRMSDAEDDILDKVDTTTFNEVSDTVDQHSQTISQHTTAISNKADSSTVTAVTNRVSKNEQDISGINTTIGELQDTLETKADGSTVSTISNKLNTVSDTVDGHTQTLTSVQNTLSTKADSSTVSTLTTKVNTISDTVDGHTSQLSSITTTQTTIQSTLDKTVKSSIQLWYSKANTTAPSKPTSQVTSTSTSGNAWRIVVPAYNASYPHYYYCWQYEYVDGTYGWSAVVRDIAMGESQSTARTADSNASAAVTTANTANTNASTALTTANTANTNASDAKTAAATASTTASEAKTTAETAASDASTAKTNAASAVSTANSASTTATNAQSTANANIKSSVQLWFTKANSTAPNKPTSVISTSNANTANAWNLVVPVWNKNYPHYFYCYQQQKGDGNYQWTDVVYDRATSEAQQLANTTSTNLSTLQTNYATFKQQTEQFESTVGTTYATKTELKGATDDITALESRVSTNETSISNNTSAIALKANSSDVYTKTAVDGKITQEVSDRNAAITAKANEITSSVSETYTTKEEFNNLEIGGRNLALNTAGAIIDRTESPDGSRYEYSYFDLGRALPFGAGTPIVISFDLYMPIKSGSPRFLVYNTNRKGPHQTLFDVDVLSGKNLPVGSIVDERIVIKTSVYADRSDSTLPNDYLEFYSNYGSNNFYRISNLKLEKGNKATDWTPAPEDIETRITTAESSITQNAQNIELKVSKDGVISSINQSAETVKIQASKVEIDGTAVFSAISSDVDDAITSKGYQTSSQVNSAITSKGYQTSSQVESAITSKGYQTASQVSTAVTNGTANLATKANAVKRTQRIWYRKSASGAPATPGTASSNWVTKADDGNDAWTKMHIAINSTHKYIYTCEQYEMANGTVGYTSVLLDNTITVIDGGNIITGSVTANKLNAANINASKSLTVGAMTDAAASTILNSNVVVGGRNLLRQSYYQQTTTTNGITCTNNGDGSVTINGTTTATPTIYCFNDSSASSRGHVTLEAGTYTLSGCPDGGGDGTWRLDIYGIPTSSGTGVAVDYGDGATFTTTGGTPTFIRMRFPSGITLNNFTVWPKLEKGNKATDWTPAPEDMATAESLAGTNESLEGAITDIGELSDQLVDTTTEQNKTITDIQKYLNSLRQDLDAEIQSRQQWLNFNAAEGLVIGAKNSTFKTVTTNTSQQFRSGGTVLAETSGSEFVAPIMRSDQILIGNWMWTRRDNGNLSLKWIG